MSSTPEATSHDDLIQYGPPPLRPGYRWETRAEELARYAEMDAATTTRRAYQTRAFLSLAVENELGRLNGERGKDNAPMGGWRNEAIRRVAEREGMNPYKLDHIIRGISA